MTIKKRVSISRSKIKRSASYHDWKPAQVRWSPTGKNWALKSVYYRREEKGDDASKV